MPDIRLESLRCVYSAGTPFEKVALDNIDLSIPAGQYAALLGHTGSGKSTLIQHLNGLLKPAAGRVLLGEEDIHRSKEALRAVRFRVGLVFQYPEYQLFEETVYRDIAFGPKNMGLNEQEVDEHVRFGAKFAGVDESLFEASPLDLSGGQKRRIAIAGVMAMKPEVLVLDEPMAGLDPAGCREILANIAEYHRSTGSTVVLVTHDMDVAAENAERLIVMRRGKIALDGAPDGTVAVAAEQTIWWTCATWPPAACARRCCSAGYLYPARSRRGAARKEGGRRMLKDITLGQYFPGNTIVHRLDPRTKLIAVVLYIAALFTANNWSATALVLLTLVFCVALSRIRPKALFKGLKPLIVIVILTAVLNLFYSDGNVICSFWVLRITDNGIRRAVLMVLRIILLVCGTFLLTYTTSPLQLTDGLEQLLSPLKKLRFPVHELSMMMSIALRFIPTLIEETDKIISAQKARGADFESGSLVRRAKALLPILVPLFVSAFRRADELATAMECRCYNGGEGRTRMKVLRMGRNDYLALAFWALILAGSFILTRYGI